MVQAIHEIEAGLAETRSALGGALDELEGKVKSAADWNTHFRASPELWMAAALGAGLLAGALTARRTSPRHSGLPPSPSSRTSQAWDQAKSDVLATGASMFLDFVRDSFPRHKP
jgi:hypothetical protein